MSQQTLVEADQPPVYPPQPGYQQPMYPQQYQPPTYDPSMQYQQQPGYNQQYQQPGYNQPYQQPAYPQPVQSQQPLNPGEAPTYDYNNINYQPMTVDQWNQVQNDSTQYSSFWDSPQAFEPSTISENTEKLHQCNDVCWVWAFAIFWVITIGFIIYLGVAFSQLDKEDGKIVFAQAELLSRRCNYVTSSFDCPTFSGYHWIDSDSYCYSSELNCERAYGPVTSYSDIPYLGHCNYSDSCSYDSPVVDLYTGECFSTYSSCQDSDSISGIDDPLDPIIILWAVCIGVGLAFVFNIMHFCYAAYAPIIYIKASLWIGIGFSVLICLIPCFVTGMYYYLIAAVVVALLSLCCYCCIKSRIALSAQVLGLSASVIRKYPSVMVLLLLEAVVQIFLSGICAVGLFFVAVNINDTMSGFDTFLIVWIVFAFYWGVETFKYVVFMATAGTMGSYYFLHDTEYMPTSPVWQSFKRASTTSFGSAAFAGFICTLIDMLQALADSTDTSDALTAVIVCLAKCVLCILEAIFRTLSYYGLIYCALFGIPLIEGARRFLELKVKKFVNLLLGGLIINYCINFNAFLFSVCCAALGVMIGWLMDNVWAMIFIAVVAFIIFIAIFIIVSMPLLVYSDTLLICFAECPDRMRQLDYGLSEEILAMYGESIEKRTGEKESKC